MELSERMKQRLTLFDKEESNPNAVPATYTEIEKWIDEVAQLENEKWFLEQLVLIHGHLPSCPQFRGPYDLGELEPACTCGFDNVELSRAE